MNAVSHDRHRTRHDDQLAGSGGTRHLGSLSQSWHEFGQFQYPTSPLEGARSGAPDAVQVADRFHLWANLGEAVEKTVLAHRSCLLEPVPTDEETQTMTTAVVMPDQVRDVDGGERRLTVRKRERYAAVQALMIAGNSLNSISRQTGLCFRTVQRYAQAGSLDELLATAERSSTLDRFKEYLLTRWNDGCTDAGRLHRELQGMGWRGSARTVQRYAQHLRGLTSAPPPSPVTPKPRKVARWLMTNPDNLTAGDQVKLKEIIARCPELEATRRHIASFASMMRELRGDHLPAWMAAVAADELPALHSFVKGLNRDLDAVTNGLTLTWSSGTCEGGQPGEGVEEIDVRPSQPRSASAPHPPAELTPNLTLRCQLPGKWARSQRRGEKSGPSDDLVDRRRVSAGSP